MKKKSSLAPTFSSADTEQSHVHVWKRRSTSPVLCWAQTAHVEGSAWARVGLAVATCSHLSRGANSPYFAVYPHLCLQVNWDEVEGLAGPKLYTLQSGNKSNPAFPLLSAGPRSCAASVESLQQTMNYGWNEKNPSPVHRGNMQSAERSPLCVSLALCHLHMHEAQNSALLRPVTTSAHRAQDSLLPRDVGSEMIFINLERTSSCFVGSPWELLRVLCG